MRIVYPCSVSARVGTAFPSVGLPMSACPLLERASAISNSVDMDSLVSSSHQKRVPNPVPVVSPGGPGPGGGGPPPPLETVVMAAAAALPGSHVNQQHHHDQQQQQQQQQQVLAASLGQSALLEKDYYGCYCLKFIVKNGTHITEEKVQEDFGQFGDVVDVRGPGLFSGLRGNHVYVRFIDKSDAEAALRHLTSKYHQLTPASISDVLPDNYGLYTISFYNKTGIPSSEVRREFSKFGEVKNLTGSLDVKGGRVFVSYKEKSSAVQALQAFFFRKDRYPNMKFALPRCEKDYFGCYCLKFYNKSGDVTEEKVLSDFGQFGEVVDVRGPGLFDVTGDDVYVRYKEKSSAEQALIELVGKYDSLCLAPPSDIQADKFGYFTITFVNDKCLSKSDVWYIFSKFGTVACVNGTFDCKKGRVFVSYKEKQGALNALETMLITKEYHLQVSKNSTVRKNDYNVIGGGGGAKELPGGNPTNGELGGGIGMGGGDFGGEFSVQQPPPPLPNSISRPVVDKINGATIPIAPSAVVQQSLVGLGLDGGSHGGSMPPHPHPTGSSLHQQQQHPRDHSRGREASLLPSGIIGPVTIPPPTGPPPCAGVPGDLSPLQQQQQQQQQQQAKVPPVLPGGGSKNNMVKFNRNVEKDIFGYFCLSFLNEDGDINEKKVRHDFGKFGEVVSVRGALGKQKGHVFVRFRRKEAAENCLNCLNSFPLSEMSELFGKYLFLSPATPRDIDCDMYGLYSISFLNLNMKTFREIRQEFSKFGEIVRLTSGGGGNTDELVSISYADKQAAVKALQNHFTNKEFPYLDIAKGSSLLLVNSSDSSDNEDNESDYILREAQKNHHTRHHQHHAQRGGGGGGGGSSDPFHDPSSVKNGLGGSDVVDELLKPLQSYFSIYRTGQYQSLHPGSDETPSGQGGNNFNGSVTPPHSANRSPDKKYRIKSVKQQQQPANGIKVQHPTQLLPAENGHQRLHQRPPPPPPPPTGGLGSNNFTIPPPTNRPPPPVVLQQQQQQQHKQQQQQQQPPPQLKQLPVVESSVLPSTASEALPMMLTSPTDTTSTPSSPASAHESPEREVGASLSAAPNANSTKVPSSQDADAASSCSPSSASTPSSPSQKPAEPPSDALSTEEAEAEVASPSSSGEDVVEQEETKQEAMTTDSDSNKNAPDEAVLHQDPLGFFSVSFYNRSKDLTERKVRLDFGSEVSRVRGLSKGEGALVTVSFETAEAASAALEEDVPLRAKYQGLAPARAFSVRPDRDGAYSIEFMNSGMSGIREITNEFSRHGEVVKVMAGGAKNAVKRVTVSYADRASAMEAVKAHRNSKDFVYVDFSKDCLVEEGAELAEGGGQEGPTEAKHPQ